MTPLVPAGHHGTTTTDDDDANDDDDGGGTNDGTDDTDHHDPDHHDTDHHHTDHYHTDPTTTHPVPDATCTCPLSSVPALMNPSRFRLRVRVEDLRVGVPIGLHSDCTDATVDMEVLRRG
jgi:hypothetical protein